MSRAMGGVIERNLGTDAVDEEKITLSIPWLCLAEPSIRLI